jgi:hypothetical protein
MRCLKEKVAMMLAEAEKRMNSTRLKESGQQRERRETVFQKDKKHALLQICQASSAYSVCNGILEWR